MLHVALLSAIEGVSVELLASEADARHIARAKSVAFICWSSRRAPNSRPRGADRARRTMQTIETYCRICEAACGLLADLDDHGKLVKLRPNRSHPVSHGFVCAKARDLVRLRATRAGLFSRSVAGRPADRLPRAGPRRRARIAAQLRLDDRAPRTATRWVAVSGKPHHLQRGRSPCPRGAVSKAHRYPQRLLVGQPGLQQQVRRAPS